MERKGKVESPQTQLINICNNLLGGKLCFGVNCFFKGVHQQFHMKIIYLIIRSATQPVNTTEQCLLWLWRNFVKYEKITLLMSVGPMKTQSSCIMGKVRISTKSLEAPFKR